MSGAAAATIGVARMLEDGTLVLDLRAEDGAGAVGISQLRYSREHPEYAQILAHLGGLSPGQSKPVPPWD
ncbi:MAG: hypothetical protein ACK4N5_05425 [Myxococcales bacterium]